MGSLTTCLKKASGVIHAGDRNAIIERSRELRRGGQSGADAARQAVRERLALVTSWLDGTTPMERAAPTPAERAKVDVNPLDSINAKTGTSAAEQGLAIKAGPVYQTSEAAYTAGDGQATADTRPEAARNVGMLERGVARGADSVHPYEPRIVPGAGELDRVAAVFGERIQGFGLRDGLTPAEQRAFGFFNGAYLKGVIFLRDSGQDRPHLSILGHEMAHRMKRARPDLYERLVRAIEPYIDKGRYDTEFRNSAVARDVKTVAGVKEEFIGEVLSDCFMDKGFWRALGQKNPSLLRDVRDFIGKLIDTIKAKIGYTKRTERILTDYDRVMQIAGEVMAEFDGRSERPSKGEAKPIQAAAIFVGGKVVTAQTHGQAINLALKEGLVKRKNGQLDLRSDDSIDLFVTGDGNVIDRIEADRLMGSSATETMQEKGQIKLGATPRVWSIDELRAALAKDSGVQFSRAAQTDTPAFKKWFGESKVVDSAGKPLVMYHGTSANFNSFKPGGIKPKGAPAIFLTDDPGFASQFATDFGPSTEGANLMPLYALAEHPFDFRDAAQVSAIADAVFAGTKTYKQGDGQAALLMTDQKGREERTLYTRGVLTEGLKRGDWSLMERPEVQSAIKAAGHDGFWVIEDGHVNLGVFGPQQIKSAIGNAGTFDAENPDIRFNRAGTPALVGTPPVALGPPREFALREFGKTALVVESIQDRYNRWKQAIADVKKQGGKITEANDFYRAEERYWGKVGAQIDDFAGEMKEFVEAVAKDKLDLEAVALYAYAEHAKERNEWIAAKRPSMPDGGSGMTTAEAQQILDDAKAAGTATKLARHAATLREWTKGTRDTLLANGLISQAEHDAWDQQFANYVPLRGLDGKTEKRGIGRGFDIRGKESKEAKGRRSRAKDIIEQIAQDRTRALIRSGKNEVLRSFLQFVLDNPSPNLWQVEAVESKPGVGVDANGNRIIEEGKGVITDERTVSVKDGGKQIHILVKDERLRLQLQNLHVESLPRVIGAMHFVNRFMSRMYTSLSPTFTVLNGARDMGEATINMIDDIGFMGAARLWANVPAAMVESFRGEFGKTNSADYETYRTSGGKTGFFDFKDVDSQAKELSALLKDAGRSRINPLKIGRKALHLVEAINGGVENATRLAAFKAARQSGKSVAEAAKIAKNISVNFNRKGTLTPTLGAWILFFNPAVQGTARVIQSLKNPKVLAALGMGMAGMAGLAMRNAAMGDDDDGVAWWDKIPEEVKERNVIIVLPPESQAGERVPGSKTGRYIKIPMPYGYSVFGTIANQAADTWRNALDPKRGRGKADAIVATLNSFLSSWMPVQEASQSVDSPQSIGLAFVPASVKPFIQNATNTNSFGRKMYPDEYGAENLPDSTRYFAGSAGTIFQKGAEGLNKLAGGTRYQSAPGPLSLLDMTPASLENLARSYGGGPVSFTLDILNSIYARQHIKREDLDWRRLPFAKQLYGVIDDETDRMVGMERINKTQKVIDPLRRAMDEGSAVDVKKMAKEAGAIYALGDVLLATRAQLSEIRKQELAVIAGEKESDALKYTRLQLLASRKRHVLQGFNRAYDLAIDAQARRDQTPAPQGSDRARQAAPALP